MKITFIGFLRNIWVKNKNQLDLWKILCSYVSVIFLPALLCDIVWSQTNTSIYLPSRRIVGFVWVTWLMWSWAFFFSARVTSPCAAERADIFWRVWEWTMAGLNGEPRLLPCCLNPTPPPLRSCNPAAVEGVYCCSPLFDAHCTYLHFSSLRSFHVRRLRIKYTRGGFVKDGGFWGSLCRRRSCSS